MNWHNKSINEILEEFKVKIDSGLNEQDIEKNRQKYGENKLKDKPKKTLFQKVLEQFKDPLILILLAAALVSMFIGEKDDSLVIILIVIINSCLSLYQEGKSEKAIENLQKISSPFAKVIRNSKLIEIPTNEIVVGDIVRLETGDIVPCDIRLYNSQNLKIDESALTGESVPAEKFSDKVLEKNVSVADRVNMAFSSSIVSYGRGDGIAVAVGENTEIGKIAEIINSDNDDMTPLQKRLAQLSKFLGMSVLIVCAIVFVIGAFVRKIEILKIFMISVSLAVAAIPEGLPAIVTIVLSIGMTKMAHKNAIVKKLLAVETLGATTYICSDKTGTLTQNQMSVTDLFANLKNYEVTGRGYNPEGEIKSYPQNISNVDKNINSIHITEVIDNTSLNGISNIEYTKTYSQVIHEDKIEKKEYDDLYTLISAAILNNDATLEKDDNKYNMIGDPTEGSLLTLGEKMKLSKNLLNNEFLRIAEIPFDSDRKMMTTFHKGFLKNKVISFTKGASDSILSRCNKILINNQVYDLDEKILKLILEQNGYFASKALRVLTFAYKEYDELPSELLPDEIEKDMTFIGLVGMIDPPREEAKVAIEECKNSGIVPMMITGDHRDTAYAIAKELKIVENKEQVITGKELDDLSIDELREIVKVKRVYARVSPQNKVQIVDALKLNNQIVAMTGDGVNDAPAIKKADIGVAMGITGTDVTKSTAEVILTDDNFATIVHAVEEGRIIYSNIKKFIGFVLPCNISEIVVMFVSILFNLGIPFLPIQLLWINLVTDSFPALAIGVEPAEKNIMKQKPRDIDEPILDKKTLKNILIQTIALSSSILFAYIYSKNIDIPKVLLQMYPTQSLIEHKEIFASTVALVTLVLAEMMRSYTSRSSESIFKIGLFSNKYVVMATSFSIFLTGLVMYVEPLAKVFRLVPLSLEHYLFIIPISCIPFVVGEIKKMIVK